MRENHPPARMGVMEKVPSQPQRPQLCARPTGSRFLHLPKVWIAMILLLLGAAFGLCCAEPVPPPAAPAAGPTRPAASPAQPATAPGLTNFAQVDRSLYRGAQPSREGFLELKRRGIRTVINLRQTDSDRKLIEKTGLRLVNLPARPSRPDIERIGQFLKLVRDPANQPVFVHCAHGADRTGLYVAAFRIAAQGWTAEEAIHELPNFGFHRIYRAVPRFLRQTSAAELNQAAASAQPPVPQAFP